MTRTLVHLAAEYALKQHAGQTRKYTGAPYIDHLANVKTIVRRYAFQPVSDEMLAAAFLHDVLEDTDATAKDIWEVTKSSWVAQLVMDLTDKHTKANYPNWNRARRKAAEVERLAAVSEQAKTIKLADMIDNATDIVANDPDFAKVYLREMIELLPSLTKGDEGLYIEATRVIFTARFNLERGTA